MAQNRIMGRRRRQINKTPQKMNSSIEDLVEKEVNEYFVVDLSRMMISMFNEFNKAHKEMLKKELRKELTEILMVYLQKNLKESIENQLKEYQHNTNRKLEKTQKQLNKLKVDFNKLQNKSEKTIKRDI
jgi:predicted transcriptional regulator